MPAVDRNLLRIGVYELRYRPDVPDEVVLSEAVTMARELSTDDSGTFVNGVLAESPARASGKRTEGPAAGRLGRSPFLFRVPLERSILVGGLAAPAGQPQWTPQRGFTMIRHGLPGQKSANSSNGRKPTLWWKALVRA